MKKSLSSSLFQLGFNGHHPGHPTHPLSYFPGEWSGIPWDLGDAGCLAHFRAEETWLGMTRGGDDFRDQMFTQLVLPWSQFSLDTSIWAGGAGSLLLPLCAKKNLVSFSLCFLGKNACSSENRQLHNFYPPVVTSCHDRHSWDWGFIVFLWEISPKVPGCPF